MKEVKYSLTDLHSLLDIGLRDNNLINKKSPFHNIAKEVYSSLSKSGDTLSNKFYKNMKIDVLRNHTSITNPKIKSFDTDNETSLILIDDGFLHQTSSDYFPGKYECNFYNPTSSGNTLKLYQDFLEPTGRISDLALIHSTGPVGIRYKSQAKSQITVKYADRYKDNDLNCVVAIIDIGEGADISIEETFENKEGCKIYKIIYLVREYGKLNITRYHDESNKEKGLNVIESQVVQFPNSKFDIETIGSGSLYNQDLLYIDSYRNCKTDVKGRFNCKNESINNIVVNVHHKDVESESNIDVKSVLDDKSYSSFLGNIIVDDDATDVKAHLTNKNLLLSDKASAVSEPQLDINTKEIECTHGCTISNINENDLYYLTSKGIDTFQATELLKEAFLK